MIQEEYIDFGSIDVLKFLLPRYLTRRVFLVTGKNSYSISKVQEHLDNILIDYQIKQYSDFSCNPKIEDVCKGVGIFKQAQCDVVIAAGGGSVIDMAKLINFFAVNNLESYDQLNAFKDGVRRSKPLIAIPTTAGSGSETTHFAVMYVGCRKFSVAHKYIMPAVAIVDPQFTISLPPRITAITGMDALSQAIESYWSVNSSSASKKFAREAIKIIMNNLEIAVNNPVKDVRILMSKASHLAGKAVNITKTTAPHAISYSLTSFFGIPHGHAVALTLPSFLNYNFNLTLNDIVDFRGVNYVKKTILEIAQFLGQDSIEGAMQEIYQLMDKIGLESNLSSLGINSEEDIAVIVNNGFISSRMQNNPRRLSKIVLRRILNNIY